MVYCCFPGVDPWHHEYNTYFGCYSDVTFSFNYGGMTDSVQECVRLCRSGHYYFAAVWVST